MGRLLTVSYPTDPAVSYLYDASGHLTNMVDSIGTTSLAYWNNGLLKSEEGPWSADLVQLSYSGRRRDTLTLAQPSADSWQTTYRYDAASRLQTITSPAGAFSYQYHSGFNEPSHSPLWQSLALPGGASITNGFDALGRLTSKTLLNSQMALIQSYSYRLDAANRRTNMTRLDGSVVSYGYDDLGQLKTAVGRESGGATRLNEKFGYAYDAAGNLQYRTNGGLVQAFVADSLNQLSNVTRTGTLTAAGATAQSATSVTVNGQGAALYADQTFASAAGLTLAEGNNTLTNIAQFSGGHLTTNISSYYLPTQVAFQYDANGNLTNDGYRVFAYDDESRLTAIAIPGAWRTEFAYDGLSRRRISRDYAWSAGAWVQTSEMRYIYDGRLVLQERWFDPRVSLSTPLQSVTYTRGLDLGGNLDAAGGIGGLLARTDANGSLYYSTDGAGNVTALIDNNQALLARYAYDPFGNTLAASGPVARVNTYRFSSKEIHANSGLYHFGYRSYEPGLQRWLNRDPIDESGGLNLHAYVGNNPVNLVDPQGLFFKEFFRDYGLGLYDMMMGDQPGQYNPNSKGALDADELGGNDRDNNVLRDSLGEGAAMAGDQATDYAAGKVLGAAMGVLGDLGGNALSKLGKSIGNSKALKCLKKGAKKLPRYEGPKPTYTVNPAHVPGQGLRPGKTPLPNDAEAVFRNAVPNDPTNPTAWFGRNSEGQIYRFSADRNGTAHFSGIDGVGDGTRNLTSYARDRLNGL